LTWGWPVQVGAVELASWQRHHLDQRALAHSAGSGGQVFFENIIKGEETHKIGSDLGV